MSKLRIFMGSLDVLRLDLKVRVRVGWDGLTQELIYYTYKTHSRGTRTCVCMCV